MITTRWQNRFNKNDFEKKGWAQGQLVCGIDEVGRGCLAGPVVAAAVILKQKLHPSLKDSKVLTPQQRIKAAQWIQKNSWYGIAASHNRLVDQHNIYQTTLLTMKRAFMQLLSKAPIIPEIVLTDAMPLQLNAPFLLNSNVFYFPFGETKSSSIAAASIIAKVMRDNLMERLGRLLPAYSFAQHKGYGTSLHRTTLSVKGASIVHRKTFLRTFDTTSCSADIGQLSLFTTDTNESPSSLF